jgi:secondary thiamine-phosphate synthase enzyme
MSIQHFELTVQTTAGTDMIDLTQEAEARVGESGIRDGLMVAFVPGSTAALTTMEYESGALNDLARAIERLAPLEAAYDHDRRWGDGNGYSHVRAALMKPSLCVPVLDGRLALGTWQQIILLDFDNRPRRRRVIIQISGEEA